MRFRGGAVGFTKNMRQLLAEFENDRDPLDAEYRERQRTKYTTDDLDVESHCGDELDGCDGAEVQADSELPVSAEDEDEGDTEQSDDDSNSNTDEWDSGQEDPSRESDRSDAEEGSESYDSSDEEWDGEGGLIEALGYAQY